MVMSSSNYNSSIFIEAMEGIGWVKWRTDSKVAPRRNI